MTQGQLGDYFKDVAWKRLSAVEVDPTRSNQREFNGVASLRQILGDSRIDGLPAHCLYFGEEEEDTSTDQSYLTWYDARKDDLKRSEYRLYFTKTSVTEKAEAGDLLIIGRQSDDSLMVIIAKEGSSFENQMFWLFGIPDEMRDGFELRSIESNEQIGFAAGLILEQIGFEVVPADDMWLDEMLRRFNGEFPPTRDFSAFARETIARERIDYIDGSANPDDVLISYMEREELLFKSLERYIVSERLETDFEDVDDFISYSLSVHNRRKSRTGYALENHLEVIFTDSCITYSRNKKTENRAKPDFLFPGIDFYHDLHFPVESLSMLAVKSTCKDRWRQALSEAARIEYKHLLTLEPSISVNQTDEMAANNLQLVVPKGFHHTYKPEQQPWLMDLDSFIRLVRTKQEQQSIHFISDPER